MKVAKAVFPVAGLGTRFLPATKVVPKELLPLVDRPLIQEAVSETVQSGIGDIVLVTAAGKSSIEDYFDINSALESFLEAGGKTEDLEEIRRLSRQVEVVSVRQKEPRGLGHAVLCARSCMGVEPFAVVLPDDLVDSVKPCLRQLLEVFERKGKSVVALQEVPDSETFRYGIIEGEAEEDGVYRIRGLVEKPAPGSAPSNLAVIGRYVLTPGIFSILESVEPGAGGEIQLTDALSRLAVQDAVYGLVIDGTRYDAGSKLGFLEATVHYALKNPEFGPSFLRFLVEKVGSQVVK
jgi:UTP--glucose-1-phosphate uridylyltransferase